MLILLLNYINQQNFRNRIRLIDTSLYLKYGRNWYFNVNWESHSIFLPKIHAVSCKHTFQFNRLHDN